VTAVLCLVFGMGALGVLGHLLRELHSARVAALTLALLAGGTLLGFHLLDTAPPYAMAAFLAAALGLRAWWAADPSRGRDAALVAGAFLLSSPWGLATEGARPQSLSDVFFSSRGGLLFWSPVLWAGLAGLGLLFRRLPRRAVVLFAVTALHLGVAAFLPDERRSPGPSSLLPVLAYLAPGLGAAVAALAAWVERRPWGFLAAVGCGCVLSNLLLMHQYRHEMVPRDDTVSFPQVAENSARLLSQSVGSPPAWPANWVFAARHRLPVERYDLLGGADLLATRSPGRGLVDVGLLDQDAASLLEGWSVRRTCGKAVCREVEGGRARLILPLAHAEVLDLSVHAGGEGALEVRLNGVPILAQELSAEVRPLSVRVPAARFRTPVNELELRTTPAGRAFVDQVALARPSI
jgi:hypothetical protein